MATQPSAPAPEILAFATAMETALVSILAKVNAAKPSPDDLAELARIQKLFEDAAK